MRTYEDMYKPMYDKKHPQYKSMTVTSRRIKGAPTNHWFNINIKPICESIMNGKAASLDDWVLNLSLDGECSDDDDSSCD